MDDVFRALADPTRRALLDRLRAQNGLTLQGLCDGIGIARQSVSKHLAVLERAGLVTARRAGRERHHYLDAAVMNDVLGRWLSPYDRVRADALANLKHALEHAPMSDDTFACTTYIHATPEQVWIGLTTPTFTTQYWGVELQSDWQPGSLVTWIEGGATIAHPEQVVLEADRPRRLAYTWHTFTTEWAKGHEIEEELRARLAAEPRSQVLFELEEVEPGLTKLTLLHTFGEAGVLREMCSQGWPRILAELKTILERDS